MRKTEEHPAVQDMSVRFYVSSKKLSTKELHVAFEPMIVQRLCQGSDRRV